MIAFPTEHTSYSAGARLSNVKRLSPMTNKILCEFVVIIHGVIPLCTVISYGTSRNLNLRKFENCPVLWRTFENVQEKKISCSLTINRKKCGWTLPWGTKACGGPVLNINSQQRQNKANICVCVWCVAEMPHIGDDSLMVVCANEPAKTAESLWGKRNMTLTK